MKFVYVITAIVSIVLYFAGIFTGVYIQSSVSKSVEEDLSSIRGDIENQQQELILFSLRGKESCSVLQSLSSSTAAKLESVSNEIRRLEQSGQKDARFTEMKKAYSSLSIRAWILMSAINENCEKAVSILYYYSFPCDTCGDQEAVLEHVKSLDRNRILTYAVDKDVNNSLVQTLVKSHDIRGAPSLVITNKVYRGFTNATVLEGIICGEINVSCPVANASLKKETNMTSAIKDFE